MLSVVLVAVYVLLVVSLESLFSSANQAAGKLPQASSTTPANRAARSQSPVWLWIFGCLFAALGMVSSFMAWEKSRESGDLRAANSALKNGATFSLPQQIGDWTRSETGPPMVSKIETLGLSSAIWNYERPGMRVVVAFDYPIWRYHDVAACYARNGWSIERKDIVTPKTGAPARFEMEMKKDPGIHGSLWFATFNEKGEWVDQSTVKTSFASRFNLLEKPQETTYRVQLFLVGNNQPDPAAFEAASQLFEEVSSLLSQQVLQHITQ
jgi:hypothetical protein